MGIDVYAHTIIGCRYNTDDISPTRFVRACEHKIFIDGSDKFCFDCGKPLWVEEECDVEETIEDIARKFGIDFILDLENGHVFFGIKGDRLDMDRQQYSSLMGLKTPDAAATMARKAWDGILDIQAAKKINGEDFGIWTVLEVRC